MATTRDMSLTPKQIRAAELLAKGHSQEKVGDAVGVSRRTIARWLKQESFRNLSFGLLGRATQAPQQSPQRLPESRKQTNDLSPQDLVGDALEAVRDILQDPDSRNVDRLKAASLVGDWAGLGVQKNKMAELEALKVMLEAEWIPDHAIDVFLENMQVVNNKMKKVLSGNDELK